MAQDIPQLISDARTLLSTLPYQATERLTLLAVVDALDAGRHSGWTEAGQLWLDSGCPTVPAIGEKEDPKWPDIGADPMMGDRSDRYNSSAAACREAYVHQQPHVPNQTALVWRWHLGALLEEHLRLNVLLSREAATPTEVADPVLRSAVAKILPIGNASLPDDRVIAIYVRMDELRAIHALAAAPPDPVDTETA